MIEWSALEYEPVERHPNWFWVVGGVAGLIVIVSILMGNLLLALLIAVGAGALLIHESRGHEPREIMFGITRRGVRVHERLYPYDTLRSFWVHHNEDSPRQISFRSEKALMPRVILPMPEELDHEEIRIILQEFLPEEPHEHTLAEALTEYLGL